MEPGGVEMARPTGFLTETALRTLLTLPPPFFAIWRGEGLDAAPADGCMVEGS